MATRTLFADKQPKLFQIDGDPKLYTLWDLVNANEDDYTLETDLAQLRQGQSIRIGGGAAAEFVIVRVL